MVTPPLMYVLNMDTVVVMLLSQLRASDIVVNDPCPCAWRAKLSDNDLDHYVNQANDILKNRFCWNKDFNTTIIHTSHDIVNLQARCQTHVRKYRLLFLNLSGGA